MPARGLRPSRRRAVTTAPLDLASLRPQLDAAWLANGTGPLVVGVSGGGDSLALLSLLRDHALHRSVVACVVDHGLQAQSEAAASLAARAAAQIGADVVLQRLVWPAGAGVSQQRARLGRHAALCSVARSLGARAVALGHTADDQAEGVMIARAREGHWRGGSGMRAVMPSPVWPEGRDLLVVRPLLEVSRAGLRAYLQQKGIVWQEDPANTNSRFVRAQARLALSPDPAFRARLAGFSARLRGHQDRADARVLCLLMQVVRFVAGDAFLLEQPFPNGLWCRLLGVLIQAVAGTQSQAAPSAIEALVARLGGEGSARTTLGGCQISAGSGAWRIARDPGAVLGRAGVAPLGDVAIPVDQDLIWDGRLLVRTHHPGWSIRPVGAGGDPTRPVLVKDAQRLRIEDAESAGFHVQWLAPSRAWRLLGAETGQNTQE